MAFEEVVGCLIVPQANGPTPVVAVPPATPDAPTNVEQRLVDGLLAAGTLGEQGVPMRDVAFALVNAGWRVLPCHPIGKHPLAGKGFNARSNDPNEIDQWWGSTPDATVGIVPGDGGLVALDVDSPDALIACIAAGVFPSGLVATLKARTTEGDLGSAYGLVVATGGTRAPFPFEGALIPRMHVYLRVMDGAPRVRGVVCRHHKGYVIAPGSRGEKLYRLLSRGHPLPYTSGPTEPPTAPLTLVAPAVLTPQSTVYTLRAPDLTRVRTAVACIPNTESTSRDSYVAMAHLIKGAAGDDGREIFLDWAAKWPGGVNPAEDERVFDTITAPRLGWSALWHVAQRFGFDSHPERTAEAQDDFDDELTRPAVPGARVSSLHAHLQELRERLAATPDVLERESTRAEQLGRLTERTRVPFRTLEHLLAAFDAPHRTARTTIIRPGRSLRDAIAAAPPAALIPGYLYVGSQHVLFGAPGAFKTFLALDWGLHLASGLPWLGRVSVPRGGVVFFAGEAASRLLIRQAAWFAARGVSVEQSEGVPFALVDTIPTLGIGDDGLYDALARIEEATDRPALLVFDNLTRMAAQSGLSIADPGELGRILAGLDALARRTGASTLIICHSPMTDQKKVAGSYPMLANPDVVLQAERGAGLTTALRSTKTRDTAGVEPLVLTLRPQGVRDWLLASYGAEGLPVPATLETSDFDAVTPGSMPTGGTGGERSFTSLVVGDGKSIAAATADAVRGLGEKILGLLAAKPEGLGLREIRVALKVREETVAAALGDLMTNDAVTVALQGRGRTAKRIYRLKAAAVPVAALPPGGR